MKNLNLSYVKNPEILVHAQKNEIIFFNKNSDFDEIYHLDSPVSIFIWRHLDGQHSAQKIVAKVINEFDVAAYQAEMEVKEFLSTLERLGFILPKKTAQ